MNILTIIKKFYYSILLGGWSYILFKCIQTIMKHGISTITLFLNVFTPYIFVILATVPMIFILLSKGKLQAIITIIQTLTISSIIYILIFQIETIKNTFLLLVSVPVAFIFISLNEIFSSEKMTKLFINVVFICFPILLLSEFAFLSMSFLEVENKFIWLIIVDVILLFVVQPCFIVTQTLPSIKEKMDEVKKQNENNNSNETENKNETIEESNEEKQDTDETKPKQE